MTVVDKQGYNIYIRIESDNSLMKSGKAYYDQKDYDRAIADFTVALRMRPDTIYLYVSRGNAYLGKGDRVRARADWSKALELDTNNTAARNNLDNFK
jgi:Flp pilus assembly protein TadD